MVFVPVPNAAIVEFRYTLFLQEVENTMAFQFNDTITQAALDILTANMSSWWYYYLKPRQTNRLFLREIFAKDQSEQEGITSTNTSHMGEYGGHSTGDDLPPNVSFCVSFRTGLSGRSYRGRNYLCGLKSSMITGACFIYPTYRDQIVAAYEYVLPGGTTPPAGWYWGVISRYNEGARRETGVCTPITAVTVSNDVLDSSRNRLPGRGR